MPSLNANGIRIAFDTAGDPKAVPLLLISGLGLQLTAWPDEFVEGLVELGFYVIRYDNRDTGLSTKFEHAGTPSLGLAWLKSRIGWPIRPPYTLEDMADDAVGVLSALGVARAHVVGVSMGGMIAQLMAAKYPSRVLSLTSIMSSSGRRGLPGPTPAVKRAMMRRPGTDIDAMIEHGVRLLQAIASPTYPTPEKQLRRRVARALRRNCCPGGVARQILAVAASGDRSPQLHTIAVPTLVIHGAADPMVPPACGVDTAEAIPNARLEMIEGMGHDLPAQLLERLLALIDAHAHGKMTPDSTPRLFVKQ
ncbi:alpha/beta hydrolase [Massilia sp. WF1]|uniref:alpha/beta fold hydrolase n=1 Tax=unclassified Massilia TaxID=2609279 RepID=UPI00064A848D|nr:MULTISPECIES: alpha/beta hydrolase [unclassified Massilia]ALK97347.1 alpha/beta hydrolase [Massilia sp. WG5]KLU36528.1 alpha/beta hydrolase [Massilia sp. WF1]